MMGSSGKVVADLDALTNLAAVLSDPDKIEAIRDEFKTRSEDTLALEKAATDKMAKAKDAEAVNQMTHNALKKWENELLVREVDVKAREQDLDARVKNQDKSESEFDLMLKTLSMDKKEFTDLKTRMLQSLEQARKDVEDDADKKAKALKKREDAVSAREVAMFNKEANLTKQSQSISDFLKTIS